jgi:putative transposase
MARIPRIELLDFPHHVTQRGNRRLQTFFSDADYRAYLRLMAEAKEKSEVSIWAYCLMPNHVHFIVVPTTKTGLARLMQHPHRRYAWKINRRMQWQGHLWQSRFYSCPLDEAHLMAAVRYVELNPVRAGLCSHPEDWRWSSVHAHVRGSDDCLADVEPMLARVSDWHSYLGDSVPDAMIKSIRENVASGRPAGGDDFIKKVEAVTGKQLRKCKPGPAAKRFRN